MLFFSVHAGCDKELYNTLKSDYGKQLLRPNSYISRLRSSTITCTLKSMTLSRLQRYPTATTVIDDDDDDDDDDDNNEQPCSLDSDSGMNRYQLKFGG